MRKVKVKLLILFFSIIIVSFLAFGFAYYFLSTNFVKREAGQSFVNSANVIATEVNNKITSDYQGFINVVDKYYEDEVTSSVTDYVLAEGSKYFDLKYVDNYYVGYIENNNFVLDATSYAIDTENNKQNNYLNQIAIYKLSNLLVDNTDQTLYIVYRYRDVIIYFNAKDYLSQTLNNIAQMDTSIYFIMENNANILMMENSNLTNIKFNAIFGDDSNYNYKVSNITSELATNTAGYGIFMTEGIEQFVVYSPILKDILESPIFISYMMEFNDATNSPQYVSSLNYLKYSIIVLFGALLLFLAVTLFFVGRTYVKKEHEFQLSRLAQYYVKPYSLICSRRGDIIGSNKTFKNNVNEFYKYKTIADFQVFESTEVENVEYLKKQKSFVIIVESLDKQIEYLRFFPVKNGNRYSLVGENCTNETLEAVKNKRVATFNTVTNLPNKLVLDNTLTELCSSNVLYHTNNAIIAIDIVDFSKINRLFGFGDADNMLKIMADKIKECFENTNCTIYNIRTSLFILLIRDVASYSEVLLMVKSAVQKLDDPIEIKQGYLTSVDIRMGLFNIEADKMDFVDPQHIYDSAITALDRARNTRLTKFSVYSSEFGKLLTRDQIMEQDLRTAIGNNEFVMFFQPQYNTKLKRIVGFEALIRWNNPKYKQDSPEHWISISEKNGMITEIGRFVIEETFKFAKLIEKTGIHISMNVSPVQLLQSGFVNDLNESFKSHKLKPGSIAVEITETFLMENSDTIISKLKLLRETGFSIHLDDFGIGYSSMLYLKDLPVDTIKIDKEFTKHMMTDKFSRVIVTKVIQIALNLNLNIIAEGVETDKQADVLLKTGCDVIQGYLISRAVSAENAIELIKKYIGNNIEIEMPKDKVDKKELDVRFDDMEEDDDSKESIESADSEIEENESKESDDSKEEDELVNEVLDEEESSNNEEEKKTKKGKKK